MPGEPETRIAEARSFAEEAPQLADAKHRKRPFCTQLRPRIPPRLLAGGLLALLAVRLGFPLTHATHPFSLFPWFVPHVMAALALGACLWWVAHRQVGTGGACLALALFAASPCGAPAARSGAATLAALGLFAMLYTAVGVAHALQGPRRKWKPRILLMAALCAFTAAAQPLACAAGLLLALAAMLYLAEERKRVLPALFGLWVASAAMPSLLLYLLERFSHATFFLVRPATEPLSLVQNTGLAAALGMALALWAGTRRSRFFGNTAPLLAAILLSGISLSAGRQALLWALPFALLFIAGVFADALEGRRKWLWTLVGAGLCALQCTVSLGKM